MDSILLSVKKLLGIQSDYTVFDTDIIVGINSSLMFLNQIGVGPTMAFSISDERQTWYDFIGNKKNLEAVKSFVYLKTRLIFDPPSNSFLVTAIENQIKELEYRLCVQAEYTQQKPDEEHCQIMSKEDIDALFK